MSATNLYAMAINTNREALNRAMALSARFGPAGEQHADRHLVAWLMPRKGMEAAIVGAIKSWLEYGDAARAAWDNTPIGQDGYAAEYWLDWAKSLRGLLSMDLGRLDGGTLDTIILTALETSGYDLKAEGL